MKGFLILNSLQTPIRKKPTEIDHKQLTASAKLSLQTASLINNGLYRYEQELWGESIKTGPDSDSQVRNNNICDRKFFF